MADTNMADIIVLYPCTMDDIVGMKVRLSYVKTLLSSCTYDNIYIYIEQMVTETPICLGVTLINYITQLKCG